VIKRVVTVGGVTGTFDVEKQRLITIRHVAIPCGVAKERLIAIGRVKAAFRTAE
jgi:hypothetical protein